MSLRIFTIELSDHNTAEQRLLDCAFRNSPVKPVLSHLPSGQPFPAGCPDVFISISHSGSWCVLAVSDQPVGIDLQQIRQYRESLPARFFPASDNARLQACPDSVSRDRLFFRLWTIREAYMKFTGRGMAEGIDTFNVLSEPDEKSGRVISCEDSPSAVWSAVTAPADDYLLSVVTGMPDEPETIQVRSGSGSL